MALLDGTVQGLFFLENNSTSNDFALNNDFIVNSFIELALLLMLVTVS